MVRVLTGALLLGLLVAGPAHATISLDDVIRMLEAGVSEQVILKAIDADEARFVISSEDLIDLTQAGASDAFLEEMLDRSVESQGPSGDLESSYRVLERPYSTYVSIGWVYDPFDYYFVTWPYYYAWVSPWHFQSAWWYYGGPCHHDWSRRVCYRADYYNRHWGSHTVWDRGYRDSRYHVPTYRSDKDVRTASLYDRSGRTRPVRADARPAHAWGRPTADGRGRSSSAPSRSGDRSRWDRGTRPSRDSESTRPSRAPEARPSRSGGSPSRGSAPDRISAPPRASSAPSRAPARSNPNPNPAPARPRR
jgi:hypothetical protein